MSQAARAFTEGIADSKGCQSPHLRDRTSPDKAQARSGQSGKRMTGCEICPVLMRGKLKRWGLLKRHVCRATRQPSQRYSIKLEPPDAQI
jgi:hypothetical protein